MATQSNSAGFIYDPVTGTPVDKPTADNAQARWLQIDEKATNAEQGTAVALGTLNAVRELAKQSESAAQLAAFSAADANQTVEDYEPRITGIEAMAGLTPESPTDGQTANLVNQPDTLTRAALNAQSVEVARHGITTPAERLLYVSPRGSDSADGLTLKTAKKTLNAAVAELAGQPGIVQLGVGTTDISTDVSVHTGLWIRGAGRSMGGSILRYTGSGSMLKGIPNARTHDFRLENVLLLGPGRTTTATALDLMDMSSAVISSFTINAFGTGILHRSEALGGAVYNRFQFGGINGNGTGVRFDRRGSNGSSWNGVKFGNNTIAVDIYNSNQNHWDACQFEVNTTAVKIDAELAGLSDNNSFDFCRFEVNTLDFDIKPNVRSTSIHKPGIFGSWTVNDAGARTDIDANSNYTEPAGARRHMLTRGGDYAVHLRDEVVFISATGATATLPSAVTAREGRTYIIKYRNGSTVTPLTVASAGGNIDGAASITLGAYQARRFISDGANWYTI